MDSIRIFWEARGVRDHSTHSRRSGSLEILDNSTSCIFCLSKLKLTISSIFLIKFYVNMFRKPYKVKSNIQMKNSEKKTFKSFILTSLKSLKEPEINFIMKENISSMKLTTHNNVTVLVYLVNKRPLFFAIEEKLFPTIFLLWQLPNIVPALATHSAVFERISSGADLMLPGISTPDKRDRYGSIECGMAVYVNSKSNMAAFAVGEALLSSTQMLFSNDRGKCVKILHTFNDHLCDIEGINVPFPKLGPPDWVLESLQTEKDTSDTAIDNTQDSRETLTYEKSNISIKENSLNIEDKVEKIDNELKSHLDESNSNVNPFNDTDYLIKYCFLKVIKENEKVLNFPIKFSNYNKMMLDSCPVQANLEIKKTSYKKVSVFLKQMEKDGFIICNEQPKGVDNIQFVNLSHPEIKQFRLLENDISCKGNSDNFTSVVITEALTISAAIIPLLSSTGMKKGDVLPITMFRQLITKYIKENNLHDKPQKGMISPNDKLSSILRMDKPLSWEEIFQKLIKSMSSCYSITTPDGKINKGRGALDPVAISVATRSGNKKVTLVDNLELYGININSFGKMCQHGVAASTSISKVPGKKYDQLLIQGNQVHHVGHLLLETFKIPKKHISGLELAPKRR